MSLPGAPRREPASGHGLASATVRFEAPLDIPSSLAGLFRWGDDLIDRWDGRRWLRILHTTDGRRLPFRARPTGSTDVPSLTVEAGAADLADVVDALPFMFVTARGAMRRLCSQDPVIRRADTLYPGVRPLLQKSPLEGLIRAISAQQVNLRWAVEIRRRLAERYGDAHEVGGEVVRSLDPERLANATVEELREIQLTRAKSASVIAVARASVEGRLELADLAALDDEGVSARLVTLPGIGPWSADWFLARTLGRPRVAAGDLGVRKAVGRAYFGGRLPSEPEVRSATAHWGAAAGLAQQLLLHDLVASAEVPSQA